MKYNVLESGGLYCIFLQLHNKRSQMENRFDVDSSVSVNFVNKN